MTDSTDQQASTSGYGQWISITDHEISLLAAADAAIAAALSTPHTLTAAPPTAPGGGRWRDRVDQCAQQVDADRLAVLAIPLCTLSRTLPPAMLSAPVAIRRMDAVLDLLDVPLNSAAVQAAFLDTLQALTDSHGHGGQLNRAARDARTYAEYLGWVHPAIGVAADFGLRYLGERITTAAVTAPVRDEQSELARTVLACHVAYDATTQRATAANVRAAVITQLQTPQDANTLPINALAIAVAQLTPLAGTPPTSAADAPDMTGWTLADARHTLTTLGVTCQVEDDLQPGGKNRLILSDSKWQVAAAHAQPTGGMHLQVRKHSDPKR